MSDDIKKMMLAAIANLDQHRAFLRESILHLVDNHPWLLLDTVKYGFSEHKRLAGVETREDGMMWMLTGCAVAFICDVLIEAQENEQEDSK